jgi:hypothetical protein
MRIAKQLLLGGLALSRFTVADDDGDDDTYPVYGNYGAENQTTHQVREGNITVHFVTAGKSTNNFYVLLSSSTAGLNHANYLRSQTAFVLSQEI